MLARFLILVAMMLFGPLFIEVYLYHPMIALEHDWVAIVPLVVSPLALLSGFLLLAVAARFTSVVFIVVCALAIAVGVVGTAIHAAMHAPTLLSLATNPNVWLGEPPILVPLSFAAGGCLGLVALALPARRDVRSPAVARMLYGMAAVCGLAGAAVGTQVGGGTVALFAVISALGFGSFAFATEILVITYDVWLRRTA
jgi:hypothetical protein